MAGEKRTVQKKGRFTIVHIVPAPPPSSPSSSPPRDTPPSPPAETPTRRKRSATDRPTSDSDPSPNRNQRRATSPPRQQEIPQTLETLTSQQPQTSVLSSIPTQAPNLSHQTTETLISQPQIPVSTPNPNDDTILTQALNLSLQSLSLETPLQPRNLFASPNPTPNKRAAPVVTNQEWNWNLQIPQQTPRSQHQIPLPFWCYPNFQPPYEQPRVRLFKADGSSAEGSTKFEELNVESQKILLQVDERISEYRKESEMLDHCSRLYHAPSDNFEIVASEIHQELSGNSITYEREKVESQKRIRTARYIMQCADFAVSSYKRIRHMLLNRTASMHNPVYHFYSGTPKRPTEFLKEVVDRLQNELNEYAKSIQEIEQLINMDAYGPSSCSSSLQNLPQIMSHVNDFFNAVASKVEESHQKIESLKKLYLSDRRRQGQETDPFLEADRREIAKKESNSRKYHAPLCFSSTTAQSSSQVSGFFPSSPMIQQAPCTSNFEASLGSLFQNLNLMPPGPVPGPSATTQSSGPAIGLFPNPAMSEQSAGTPSSWFNQQSFSNMQIQPSAGPPPGPAPGTPGGSKPSSSTPKSRFGRRRIRR